MIFYFSTVKDVTISLLVVLLYFVLPQKYTFLKFFNTRRRGDLPKKASESLLTWQFVQEHMEWGLIFLLGGGFALSGGGKATGMNNKIGSFFLLFEGMSQFLIVMTVTTVVQLCTEVSSNMTIASIVLPVFAEMVR